MNAAFHNPKLGSRRSESPAADEKWAERPQKLRPTQERIPVGRRKSPRLRLSIPARFISLYGTHRCILMDLSRTGAQLCMERPFRIDETGLLEIANREVFCEVVRKDQGKNGGINGLVFDPPLEEQDVLDIRRYAETYQVDEMQALRSEVRDWVHGITRLDI